MMFATRILGASARIARRRRKRHEARKEERLQPPVRVDTSDRSLALDHLAGWEGADALENQPATVASLVKASY
jgi:hypothetical protein